MQDDLYAKFSPDYYMGYDDGWNAASERVQAYLLKRSKYGDDDATELLAILERK